MAGVTLTNVTKAFGATPVLHDMTLDIADGDFVVFVGPSGCGKSTLLRLIAGLEEVTAGEIRIGGTVVNHVPPARRRIAMVFQNYALYPHMTVYGNMAFGLKLQGISKPAIDDAVRAAARTLHLEDLLDRKPKALSGGQRQRVAIGRAIVRKPEVFLFDEPLSNLDAALRVRMRYELASLHDELATTMIYVTHDQVEAMTLADRIVVLSAGRIEQAGTPLDLYNKPDNLFVAGFIGSPKMNLLEGEIVEVQDGLAVLQLRSGDRLRAAADANRLKAGPKVTLGIRPEHWSLDAADNAVAIAVQFVERLGGTTFAYGALKGADVDVTVQLPGDSRVHAGDVLRAGVRPELCHLFDSEGSAMR